MHLPARNQTGFAVRVQDAVWAVVYAVMVLMIVVIGQMKRTALQR